MGEFQTIVDNIKTVKIQGAENIAKAGAKALFIISQKKSALLLEKARKILLKTRPTEPCLRNVLNYIMFGLDEGDFTSIQRRVNEVMEHFEKSDEKIAEIGAKKINNGGVIFTHCHSSAVIEILKKAKKQGKRFQVHNTETRPLFQGRKTAKELALAGIPVVHYVDSAARLALKHADLMLIGADAISSEGKIINKIGSELFAEYADKQGIPIYSCMDSWKFDPKTIFGYEEKIEEREGKEVWATAPKGIKVDNHAFERVESELVTGVISELGIYHPEVFVEEVKKAYPWMF